MKDSIRLILAVATLASALPAGAVQPANDPETGRPELPLLKGVAIGQARAWAGAVDLPDPPPPVAGAAVLDVEPAIDEAALTLDLEPAEAPAHEVFKDHDDLGELWITLVHGRDLDARLDAARKLRRHSRTPRASEPLLAVLKDEAQPTALRVECARTLSWFSQAKNTLRALMNESKPDAVRRACAWASLRGRSGWFSPEAFVRLGRDADSPDRQHEHSKRLVKRFFHAEWTVVDRLRELLRNGERPLVRASAAWNLGFLSGNKYVRQDLARAALDPDPFVRAVVAEAMTDADGAGRPAFPLATQESIAESAQSAELRDVLERIGLLAPL